MRGRRSSLLSRIAIGLVFLFVLVPVTATVGALFFENSQLAQGMQISAWSDYSLLHAIAKFQTLEAEGSLLPALLRSLFVALVVGSLTAWSAMVSAFCLSRLNFGRFGAMRFLGYAAYLTPPVILVISLGWLSAIASGATSALLVLVIGQSAFLFPLNYALALGYWTQTAYAIDRTAASDGAGLFVRLRVHVRSGPPFAFFGGLALLTFMLSWSDVLFSRYLLMRERDQRLLTDLVIEHLKANDVVAARGELAAVALLAVLIAGVAASAYAFLFNRANEVA